ncbi:hypothetical protein EWB00_010183 [Schistosoma japonicum]|uniref:Uncharacterized protein n=1 Tax=Schistosoma japonicum TaxID=6182 RepID=A0A4Z2DPQ3_SCHJA|nr:hypothetical protein EWB00_010183 [Schistosoma japonicum]
MSTVLVLNWLSVIDSLKAAMSDTYGRFGEAVFSCWVEGGKYHLKLSTEVLVQIGLFGSDYYLKRRIRSSVIQLESMEKRGILYLVFSYIP